MGRTEVAPASATGSLPDRLAPCNPSDLDAEGSDGGAALAEACAN